MDWVMLFLLFTAATGIEEGYKDSKILRRRLL